MEFKHISVLLNECIEGLSVKEDGTYADGTLGGAGHASVVCSRLSENGHFIGIDQDEEAIAAGTDRLAGCKARTDLVRDNFKNFAAIAAQYAPEGVDGILLDLGVSSHQLDEAGRGFSYMQDAPLDMRMDQRGEKTAADIVATYSKEELARVISEYGEENWADRIAQFIVTEREKEPILTTGRLVGVIKMAVPKGARRDGPHPAKRTFQALRIELNNELGILEQAIRDMVDALNPGGRICIITFHSLEDRIVKECFRSLENPCTCPKEFPVCVCGKKPVVKVITKKPILPSNEELEQNPRSRSAKLRIAEKI